MSVRVEKILSSKEFAELNKKTMDAGMYNTDRRVFLPGMGYEMDWYFDPTGEKERLGKHVMFKLQDREDILSGKKESRFLSIYYWRDWSHIRPPVCLICPNKEIWELDRTSLGGPGWKITGEFPNITVTPSIVLPGYHGILTNGVFSADLEGRGPNGTCRL